MEASCQSSSFRERERIQIPPKINVLQAGFGYTIKQEASEMKFSDGYSNVKEGFRILCPTEVRDVNAEELKTENNRLANENAKLK
jgi:hypothetical protein